MLLGMAFFLQGLEQALFPLGRLMAAQLTAPEFLGDDLSEAFVDIRVFRRVDDDDSLVGVQCGHGGGGNVVPDPQPQGVVGQSLHVQRQIMDRVAPSRRRGKQQQRDCGRKQDS